MIASKDIQDHELDLELGEESFEVSEIISYMFLLAYGSDYGFIQLYPTVMLNINFFFFQRHHPQPSLVVIQMEKNCLKNS